MLDLLLSSGSYLAIVFVLVVTGAGIPIPEEVPVVAGGVLAASGSLEPIPAFLCCVFGAIAGDCVMYWIGYHFGQGVLRDHRWWARLVTPEREASIERQFRRHGLKVFFVARFLVGLRTPVYLTAGILRVSFRRFFFIDLLCATCVVGTFFWLSYAFGQSIAHQIREVGVFMTLIAVVATACVIFFLWRRRRRISKTYRELSPSVFRPHFDRVMAVRKAVEREVEEVA